MKDLDWDEDDEDILRPFTRFRPRDVRPRLLSSGDEYEQEQQRQRRRPRKRNRRGRSR